MTTRVVLSAGANMDRPHARLASVVQALGDRLVAASQVYTTAPWGGVSQDDFLNQTLIAEGDLTPEEWLALCQECERAADRTREVRWGPRTLDVDVISVETDGGAVLSDDAELTLPHPRAAARAFVLVPWLEVDPRARLWTPTGEWTVAELVAALPAAERDGVRVAEATR